MNRLNRRRFMALSSAGAASAVLVACGNPKPTAEQVKPTQIPDVAGAPPTLAPITATPGADEGAGQSSGGGEQASGGGGGGATTVKVEAGDIFFDPTEFSIAPGGTIELENTGVLEHDLAVDDWGGVVIGPLNGGEDGTYTVPDDAQPGDTFEFYCSIPGHKEAGMVGKLTIAEAGEGGGEEETTEDEGGEQAAGGGAESAEIEAFDIGFNPTEFTIAPGGTITLNNTGVLEHDFVVDAWDGFIIGPLNGGDSDSGTVPDGVEPGEYEFYCSIPGHKEAGMVGKVTVSPAGEGGGESDSAAAEEEDTGAAASGGGEGGASTVDLEGFDIGFEPKEFSIAPGGTINMDNTGVLEHDFAVDDWGGVVIGPLKGGDSGSFTVPDDAQPGETFDFYCSIPGHKEAGMVGKLTIAEAGGGGGESDGGAAAEDASPEASPSASPEASPAAGGGEGEKEFTVKAVDIDFDPKEFTIARGGKITLENDGVLEHDFAVDEWGGFVIGPLKGGDSDSGNVPDDVEPGEYEFYCSIPGHKEAGMVGKVTVV